MVDLIYEGNHISSCGFECVTVLVKIQILYHIILSPDIAATKVMFIYGRRTILEIQVNIGVHGPRYASRIKWSLSDTRCSYNHLFASSLTKTGSCNNPYLCYETR